MKTEKEYADELVSQHASIITELADDIEDIVIQCAINDVTNTIRAMSEMKLIFSDREIVLKYYQAILQILKERL